MPKYKTNVVPMKQLKEVQELLVSTEVMMKQLREHVQEHIDYNKFDDEDDFFMNYGVYRPYNSDVIDLAKQIRKNMLRIRRVFD